MKSWVALGLSGSADCVLLLLQIFLLCSLLPVNFSCSCHQARTGLSMTQGLGLAGCHPGGPQAAEVWGVCR